MTTKQEREGREAAASSAATTAIGLTRIAAALEELVGLAKDEIRLRRPAPPDEEEQA